MSLNYNLNVLDTAYGGRPETILRIKRWREQHSGTIDEAVAALVRQLDETLVTPEQVRSAILVLNASVAEQLEHIDQALRDELTDAIDLAAYGPIEALLDDEPPMTPSV